jgi:hypothetical protein
MIWLFLFTAMVSSSAPAMVVIPMGNNQKYTCQVRLDNIMEHEKKKKYRQRVSRGYCMDQSGVYYERVEKRRKNK